MKKKNNFRKGFRKHKKNNHPAFLIDEKGRLYKYIGLTHSKSTNGLDNIELSQNPNPKDKRTAYVRPVISEDVSNNFGRGYNSWKFANKDKIKVQKIIDKDKK